MMQAPKPQKAKPKKKAMGMRSTQPRMQGPISGGAGGGFTQQPGPGTSGMPMPGKVAGYDGPSGWNPRGPMPLPPSAAPRPGMPPMGPPMRPGPPMGGPPPGQPFQGGGFQPPGQPPAGGPMGPPPMMDEGMGAPRGIPQGAGGYQQMRERLAANAGGMQPGGRMPGGPMAGDARQTAMAQMQAAQQRMGQMQKPPGMMGSVGPPPGPGGGMGPGGFDQNQMPAGRQAPDMAALQQMMAARGGQPQF